MYFNLTVFIVDWEQYKTDVDKHENGRPAGLSSDDEDPLDNPDDEYTNDPQFVDFIILEHGYGYREKFARYAVDWDAFRTANVGHVENGRPAGLSDHDDDSMSDPDESYYADTTFVQFVEIDRGQGYVQTYALYNDGTMQLVDHDVY